MLLGASIDKSNVCIAYGLPIPKEEGIIHALEGGDVRFSALYRTADSDAVSCSDNDWCYYQVGNTLADLALYIVPNSSSGVYFSGTDVDESNTCALKYSLSFVTEKNQEGQEVTVGAKINTTIIDAGC